MTKRMVNEYSGTNDNVVESMMMMIESPGDMFKEEFAWVDVAQVLLAALALGQLLQQVFVHVPDHGHHEE